MEQLEKLHKLLTHLHTGHLVEIERRCYGMTEDYHPYLQTWDGDNDCWHKGMDKILGIPDHPLEFWIKLANKLSDDQLFIMGVNKVLNDIRRKKRKK